MNTVQIKSKNMEIIDTLEKYSAKKIQLSGIKRRECINQIERFIREQPKEETKKVQDRIVAALISQQMTSTGGRLMMMAIVKCLCLIFEVGDYTRMTNTLITPLSTAVQASSSNNQISLEERLSKILILSKLFQKIKMSCFLGSPPSKELVDMFLKIGSKSSDNQVRIHSFQALTRVLKAAPQNLSVVVPELVKNYAKILEKLGQSVVPDPDYFVKIQCIKGLRALVKMNFSFSMLAQYFELIQTLSLKGFQDDAGDSQVHYQELLVAVFCLRLEETQRQGDLKMSYREHSDNLAQGIDKNKKKSTAQPLEAPRTLGEIISYFAAQMYKNHLNGAFVTSITKTLSKIIQRSLIHFQACDLDHLLNSVLLSLQTQGPKDPKEAQASLHSSILFPAFELFKEIIHLMTDAQRQLFLEHLTSTLDKKQLVMSKETVEQFTPQFNSIKDKLRVSSMINSHDQTELCLKTYAFLIEVLSDGELSQIFQNESSLLSPVMRYLQDQPKVSTQMEAKRVIITNSQKISNLQWIQNMLYQFLQLTTIENADLQTFSVGGSANLDQLEQKQKNLNTLAECMSSLLKEVANKSQERAVPLALAESTLKVVKGLVLGNFVKSDAQEKELGILCYPLKLNEVLESEELGQSRREAGWILVQGLLAQGESWMRQNIETFLMMFYSLFNKDICGSLGFTKVSQILREFDLKVRALSALHYLIKTYRHSLLESNKNHLKLVSSLLCNCLQFLFTNSKDKEAKELVQIFQKASPRQYKEAKLQLLECIYLVNHPNYFQPKMILILHLVCEQIVSSKKMADLENAVFPAFIDSVDFVGGFKVQSPIQPPSINDQLIKLSIELFARLFLTKGSLTAKNKLQLMKHLESHSIIDEAKQEAVHPSRLIKIGLTCLCLARGNSSEEAPRNYVLQPLDESIILKIKQTTHNLLKYQSQCAGLDRVLGELILYMNLEEIRRTPKLLPTLLNDTNNGAMLVSTKSYLVAHIFRVLDYQSVLKDNIDVDADFTQFFKQSLASKEITPDQVAVIAYSIYKIFKHVKHDVVPAGLMQNLFALSLQCLHTGPMTDKFDGRSLYYFGKLASELIRDKNPLATSSKIAMIDRQDFDWNNIKGGSILLSAFLSQAISKALRNQETKVQSHENISSLIRIFKDPQTQIQDRILITQLLALMTLQGSIFKVIELGKGQIESVSLVVLDLMNHVVRYFPLADPAEVRVPIENLAINIDNAKVLNLLQDSPTSTSTQLDLLAKLSICGSLALKSELSQQGNFEQQFVLVISNLKSMLSFKFVSEYEYILENPTSSFQSLKQTYSEDLHEQTLFEYCHFFYSLLLQVPEDADKILKLHLFELITLSFKLTQRDQVKFKKIGVEMMSQIIQIFKDTEERLGDDEDSDDNGAQQASRPLLLEQYEAQIHSVIRSSLQDQLKSFLYAEQLYRLIHQFLTLGICKDETVIAKTIEQLQSIYVTSGARLEKARLLGGNQDFSTLSQQYPEKIVANSFVQKLSLINRISPIFVPDMEESYIKLLRDFLIVTCAQAQDAKNPNCIKDIKSLKILYPSGLACAIDMKCLIQCILSILKLKAQREAAPSQEFKDLSFQCALILLNSQPESLQLPEENDTVEVIKIRIEILKWLAVDLKAHQDFMQGGNLDKLFLALKSNFDLGIVQLNHQVVQVYRQILSAKQKDEITEFQNEEIQKNTSRFKKSLASRSRARTTEQILQDLDQCQMEQLSHLGTGSALSAETIESLIETKLQRMHQLVQAEQTSQSQVELNKAFKSVLAFIQDPKTGRVGGQILAILRSNLVKLYELDHSQAVDFVVRAYCMLGFFAFTITDSLELHTVTQYADAFKTTAGQEAFMITQLMLWTKDPDENLSWPLFALVTSKLLQSGNPQSDQSSMATIEFLMKFYTTYNNRTGAAQTKKKETLAVIFSVFFTLMQMAEASLEVKNKCAQSLVQLVNLDRVIFKELVQANTEEQNVCSLSMQEKTFIQNLIIRMSGAQAQPPSKENKVQEEDSNNQGKKTSPVKKLAGPLKK